MPALKGRSDDIADRFNDVARLLASFDVDKIWRAATEVERFIDEFLEEVTVFPDYLDVKVLGAPPLHVRYQEVGLKQSDFVGVRGAFATVATPGVWRTEWGA